MSEETPQGEAWAALEFAPEYVEALAAATLNHMRRKPRQTKHRELAKHPERGHAAQEEGTR